jgi:hypothetical protein
VLFLNLAAKLKNRCSDFVVPEASEEFVIHTAPVRLRSAVYGVTAARPCVLWLFVGKQAEQFASDVHNQVQFFQFHDEFIVDFDPGGISSFLLFSVFTIFQPIQFRLWWIPWDRGKKRFSDGTFHRSHRQSFCATFTVPVILSPFFSDSTSLRFSDSVRFSDSIEIKQV